MALFEAKNLSVSYRHFAADSIAGKNALDSSSNKDEQEKVVLENVSFTLEAGCIYDLTGPSGAGKSMLLRACALMMRRRSGKLFLNGVESDQFNPEQWRRQVCLVPQKASLVAGTLRDNLLLPWTLKINQGSTPPGDAELEALLEQVGLNVGLNRNAAQLSGGQAARVALLRSFITKPTVLFLDEVDAALDDVSAQQVGLLTSLFVDDATTCLRIRHRSADGFAQGLFHLEAGVLTFRAVQNRSLENEITEDIGRAV